VKYYIEYPIPIQCNLRCHYCFHQQLWRHNERYPNNQYGGKCAFTVEQYKAWRDKHLADGTEFLCDLHGGEMSFGDNREVTLRTIDALDKERFQLQTNGTGDRDFYRALVDRKGKIDRIGFTYHRGIIGGSDVEKFYNNVLFMRDNGITVYVKELLLLDNKAEILNNKAYWESRGVEFRIQDFKGDGGLYANERVKYKPEDWALIHPEYCHYGKSCQCREGYRQVLIRGYDTMGGDVLACWQDHRVVGNIVEDWYEPARGVDIDNAAPRGRTVDGAGEYRSDYLRDVEISDLEYKHYKSNRKEFWMLARMETELGLLVQRLQECKQIAARIPYLEGAIEVTNTYIEAYKEEEAKAAKAKETASKGDAPNVPAPVDAVTEKLTKK
jgi:hypothetical protein